MHPILAAASEPLLFIIWDADGRLDRDAENPVKAAVGSDSHSFYGGRPLILSLCEDGCQRAGRMPREARRRRHPACLLIAGVPPPRPGAHFSAQLAEDAESLGAGVVTVFAPPALREPHRRLHRAHVRPVGADTCHHRRGGWLQPPP